jgi:hypothetical protein
MSLVAIHIIVAIALAAWLYRGRSAVWRDTFLLCSVAAAFTGLRGSLIYLQTDH